MRNDNTPAPPVPGPAAAAAAGSATTAGGSAGHPRPAHHHHQRHAGCGAGGGLHGRATCSNSSASVQIANICMHQVKRDIYRGIVDCSARGLVHAAKWLAELNQGIDMQVAAEARSQHLETLRAIAAEAGAAAQAAQLNATSSTSTAVTSATAHAAACAATTAAFAAREPAPLADAERTPAVRGVAPAEADAFHLARCFYDAREYARAAHFTRHCQSAVPQFLHHYCTYMAREKRYMDSLTDSANLHQPAARCKELAALVHELRALHSARRLDGYGMYLFGVVLKKIDLPEAAMRVLAEAVRNAPTLWSAWFELAPLVTDREKLARLPLPDHWMRYIFTAHVLVELFQNDEGLQMFEELQQQGFVRSTYITSQMATAYHNKRNVDKAIAIFQHIQEIDPFRLENLDMLSNLLFVKDMKKEMAFLAHRAVEINKYRPETCCVIGNYYSIRTEHQKAIVYFQRALRLDPQYLSAWTLMGHEFMEMKNTNAAIQSYRKTVEVSRRDYRAWYGLGQAYEILKMPSFSVYYYKIAQQLRPYDSRMLVALGETYEKLEKHSNALRCYRKACSVGDIEGCAQLRLADLYRKLGDIESAVPAYLEFCGDERAAVDKQNLCRALVTLGNYYESVGSYDQATHFAYRCLHYDDTKLEARSLLKTIQNNRGQQQQKNRQQTMFADIMRTLADDTAATAAAAAAAAAASGASATPSTSATVAASQADSGLGASTTAAAAGATTTTSTASSGGTIAGTRAAVAAAAAVGDDDDSHDGAASSYDDMDVSDMLLDDD